MVNHDVLKLEVKRLREQLNAKADEVFGLQNRKFQLQMSMEERQQEIKVHSDVLKAQLKAAEEERHATARELSEKLLKVDRLSNKYDIICGKLGDGGGVDGPLMRSGLVAQLRLLMGLPDTPSLRLAASTEADGRSHPAIHWLEAEAVQQACVRAHIDRAEVELRRLPTYTRAAPEFDMDAVHAHAVAAWAHVLNSSRHAARGETDLACAHAARASRRALEAVRHPSLLSISELPDNYWMSTWPPLFFPIATAVGSALFTEIKEARREARRARAPA